MNRFPVTLRVKGRVTWGEGTIIQAVAPTVNCLRDLVER